MKPELIDRYLNFLSVQRQKPAVDALFKLVRAQVVRVPFENVSKLYYKKHHKQQGLPDLESHLDGMERFHFGGTCYSNNIFFYQLLASLGYQVSLCGADMQNPDVHLVSMVKLEQREYLVDVGYAAPFLTPLPCDHKTDYILVLGRDQYVLKPRDDLGYLRMELYRDGNLKHSYKVNPKPRKIQEFDQVIANSYREDSTFMKAILLARFFPNRSIVIHNLAVIESQGTKSSIQILKDRDELVQATWKYFMIPEEFTRDVVEDMDQFNDAWS